jgi:hypothetical protein
MATPILNVLTNALIEAEWLAQGENPQQEDANFALSKFNDLVDEWAANERYVWAEQFNEYTLTPGLSPHTIGPNNATFAVAQRPVKLVSAAILIPNGDGTVTDLPIPVEDADWWANVRIKSLESQIPTHVYYEPDWPNGSLFFWPIPDQNYQTRLETWSTISQLGNLNTSINLPPAYRKALTLTLAEELGGPRSADPTLSKAAYAARSAIWSNNAQSPRISTAQAGMTTGTKRKPDFNFLDGTPW